MRRAPIAAAALVIAAGSGLAPALAQDGAVARFDAFARRIGPLCASAPSTLCFEEAFEAIDRDRSEGIELMELMAVRTDLERWLEARGQELRPLERRYLTLGLQVVDLIGLATLFGSYDSDGDGRLSRAEVTADITLDERRLGAVVGDPDAVDWTSIRARLGALAAPLLPP